MYGIYGVQCRVNTWLTFNCDFLFPTTLKKSTLHVHGSLMDGERHGTIQEDACKSDLTKRRYALRIVEA